MTEALEATSLLEQADLIIISEATGLLLQLDYDHLAKKEFN